MTSATAQQTESRILNIAAYKFVQLDNLQQRRETLKALCDNLGLRGTILLSPEGINLFLAGGPNEVEQFLGTLRSDPAFANLETKDSYSTTQPFRRMLVRLKKEIIAFGIDGIAPEERTSPKLPAQELRKWLDEGRPVRLLDVRNDYEFELGTFAGAEQLDIEHFREFPKAIEKLPEDAKQVPLVMFCTGGIRCEKAGPLMERAGFQEVYQLDGGILKYFEECGDAHYNGSCFVFDGRVALDPQLQPTGNILCFVCQAVLSEAEFNSDKFKIGKSCPKCYKTPQEQHQQRVATRASQLRELAATQPGCTPYTGIRRMHVPRKLAGLPLIEFLTQWHPPTPRQAWLDWIAQGRILQMSSRYDVLGVATAETLVKEGECFEQQLPDTIEPAINPLIDLLYEDQSLVVVNKPAPLPVHPSGRYNRNSLTSLLAPLYPNESLRIAHRLDAATSGVVVLCRKYQASRFVQPQFAAQTVEKQYVAQVHGHPAWDSMQCDAPISAKPSAAGGRKIDSAGQSAATEFHVLRRLPDGTSLLKVTPLSGRTHQIRLHACHLGHPLVGDALYPSGDVTAESNQLRSSELSSELSSGSQAPPTQTLRLHAASITLQHPDTRSPIVFTAPMPAWAERA
ncbi:sulfurtransferase [Aureliella helgolandensis]|uniref:tRNA uridine(34) hydroxylase n=1 Tax=Aureliella helgolandensis TaxID=2527968 RepID=A0A518G7K4_9BACT|nr:sulfurtransferase [Aureliella helgolandensis]QDV24562.1 Ribosomal large subunit pseudouridine synthase A [Aureliella helgolandensis]